jgi:hypothetical protein
VVTDECPGQAERHKGLARQENYRLAIYYGAPMWGWKILDWMERVHGAAIATEPW